MKIYIFRHGEKQLRPNSINAEENRINSLTHKGIKQIENLSKILKTTNSEFNKLEVIYTSPFPRCIQSAEIVRSHLKIRELKPLLILSEIYAFSDYSRSNIDRRTKTLNALADINFCNETDYSFKEKAQNVIDFFVSRYENNEKILLISSHYNIVISTIRLIHQMNGQSMRDKTEFRIAQILEIEYDGSKFEILSKSKNS